MSSSSSSSPQPEPQPEKLKGIMVVVEDPKEKEMENNSPQDGLLEDGSSETRTEMSVVRSGPVRTGQDIMQIYPAKSNKIYSCHFCNKGFSTCQALGGHQNGHKQEREWDKKRKAMQADYPGLAISNPYLDKPHLLLGGYSQDSLSNENHLGITLESLKRSIYPSSNRGFADMNMMTIVPRLTPTRFFGGSSTSGSSSRGLEPIPSHNNIYPPLTPRMFTTFPPDKTTYVSSDQFLQENILREDNLISKIEKPNIVKIDDGDGDDDGGNDKETEEGKSKSWGIDLSLAL